MLIFRRSSWWYMACLRSFAWVAVFVYMWHRVSQSQGGIPEAEKLNLPCYFPDESIPDKHLFSPCPNSQDEDGWSSCCRNSDICTSNGYCVGSRAPSFYRGACSKKNWQTNACASVCMNEPHRNDTAAIIPCNDSVFVCGYARNAIALCDDPAETFQIRNDTPMEFYMLPNVTGTHVTAISHEEL